MKLKVFIGILALVILASAGVSACQPAPRIKWRMATSWTGDNLFYVESAKAIAQRVNTMSGGRLAIEPYTAGSIGIGALEVFAAVSQGKVESAHAFPSYWRDKERSFELFTSIPNQMVAQEWTVWLYGPSRGIDLWRELYAKYNIVPFPGGLSGSEFGFFTKKPVRTLEDFQGLKLRVSGIAAEVVAELGASAVLLAPGDIKAALEKGDIDGFEFSTPAVNAGLGLHDITPYATMPSWHQPSAINEVLVNRDAWESLPDDLKAIFEAACKEVAMVDFIARTEGENAEYLSQLEQGGTQIFVLDAAAMAKISEIANRLADEQAAKDPFYAKVLKSQRDFLASYRTWEQWGDYKLYSK